jgi:hypothetical protein
MSIQLRTGLEYLQALPIDDLNDIADDLNDIAEEVARHVKK